MNWFDTSGLTSLAKTALKEAQKTIDKALDIQDEIEEDQENEAQASTSKTSPGSGSTPQKDSSDFFASWGLTASIESNQEAADEQPVVTESPSKSNSQSLWGSFAGSFFEQPKTDDDTIVRPPKAKSMNVLTDTKYGSHDDLFSRSQLVMSDGAEGLNAKEDAPKADERRSSSISNKLSLASSRHSSDSVEVLSQSMKTTPDSEAASAPSLSHSGSAGLKLNSESVEILPDSLMSPSSIECLGFDSYSSDKNSSPSSNLSPGDLSDKKSTPVGDKTEKAETADSVSLVADDDEDTMSYNSISECTAPTVLDTDENVSPFPKSVRELPRRIPEKDLLHLDQTLVAQRMQVSENSSNDGSWSDRTLNADDSVGLEAAAEEQRKEMEQEDLLMEKLSDSSSFYNVNVAGDLLRSESSAFVNVEKQQCSAPDSSDSSQKDASVKERTSPIGSDSKSDLVKIGSDRTSGHTSADELETATSSDIEIIPSPNGDNGNGCRSSPGKYGFKQGKFDGATSPNLVDLVLGKSLAMKIRGHTRELSEASIQSNTSDDSQGSENERLMRRLCEMAEILDARENRLMEVSRSNAELVESNASLKIQVDSLMAKQEGGGDISVLTEDYTHRMSALEKKFQQAIRDKDQLRKQLDSMKVDTSHKSLTEMESSLKEKDEMIAQLQQEGEKLARQELQHSTIIKKLRANQKETEQLIKGLKERLAEQAAEVERMRRALAAKEELEVSQIEAVYRLTTANKKMEAELIETRGALDDATQRYESARASLEAARGEAVTLRGDARDAAALRAELAACRADAERAGEEAETLRHQLRQLREERAAEEQRWVSREAALRREAAEAREACAEAAAGTGAAGAGAGEAPPAALLQQLAALQRAALQRDRAHAHAAQRAAHALAEAQASTERAAAGEAAARAEAEALRARLDAAERGARGGVARLDELARRCDAALDRVQELEQDLQLKNAEIVQIKRENETRIAALERRASETDAQLAEERAALDTERKRSAILQEQLCPRGDVSPAHSVASDTFSTSFWQTDETAGVSGGGGGAVYSPGAEEALSALSRSEGARRSLAAAVASLRADRAALAGQLARLHARLADQQSVQEQYDALLQMYGEKEEQLAELRLDLHDVTQLYKAQLDELVALKR